MPVKFKYGAFRVLINELMDQIPWEAASCWNCQEISCILWNLKFYYHLYERVQI